jgi:hypothetical protein
MPSGDRVLCFLPQLPYFVTPTRRQNLPYE